MTVKIELDRAGFPMLWVEQISAYLQWLPVTKIQFEYFICDALDSRFDETWYRTILDLNPRISPQEIRTSNYWQALLTGITPTEAEQFAAWCGPHYAIPTLDEWFGTYTMVKESPPISLDTILKLELKPRIRALLEQLDMVTSGAQQRLVNRTLADQILLRQGVMEWVVYDQRRNPWGLMGKTPSTLYSNLFTPDSGRPSVPNDPKKRVKYHGFRLLRRGR